jgi:hypothetical protein
MNSITARFGGFSAAVLLVVSVVLAWLTPQAAAQHSDTEVKAGFIRNFAQLSKWPAKAFSDSDAPFIIGIFGDDSLSGTLERDCRDKKSADGREIRIKRARQVDDLKSCQLVFVSKSESGRVGEILSSFPSAKILTVGEGEQFTRVDGGAIGILIQKGQTPRFEVKLSAVRGVDVSRLLGLGKVVK